MNTAIMGPQLLEQVRQAMRHVERFEATERMALRHLAGLRVGAPVDALYVDVATRAFEHRYPRARADAAIEARA